jgi:hypothetical protein
MDLVLEYLHVTLGRGFLEVGEPCLHELIFDVSVKIVLVAPSANTQSWITHVGILILARQDASRDNNLLGVLNIHQARMASCCSLELGAFCSYKGTDFHTLAESQSRPALDLRILLLESFE